MENLDLLDDEDLGMSAGEIRLVAQRQFAGSLVAGAIIVVVAALMALKPAYHEADGLAFNQGGSVHQPTFVTSGEHVAAANLREIELP